MKKLFTILVMLITMSASAQWVQMSNGIGTDKSVFSLALSGNNIFVGMGNNGVFLSTNFGTNWIQTALNNRTVYALLINGNNIFAGTYSGGVYHSTNNGTNWTQIGLNTQTVLSLAITGSNIFAGTSDSGIYLSSNNGTNWSFSALGGGKIHSLAVSGNKIFAGTEQNGIYTTTNNGTNWIWNTLNNKTVNSFGILGSNIFAGVVVGGVYLSTNDGVSWSQTALNNLAIMSLAVNGSNIFAGTEFGGVYLSTNNGTSWINKGQGLNNSSTVPALLISNNFIFAGTWGNSIWRRSLSEIIGIQTISTEIPSSYSLRQNYPNPFNPMCNVQFSMCNAGNVKLVAYDVQGREVQTLVNEKLQPGTYEVKFDGTMLNSGVYFYRIQCGDFISVKRMVMVK